MARRQLLLGFDEVALDLPKPSRLTVPIPGPLSVMPPADDLAMAD